MKFYMDTNKISYPKSNQGLLYSSDQWKSVIRGLRIIYRKNRRTGSVPYGKRCRSLWESITVTAREPPHPFRAGISLSRALPGTEFFFPAWRSCEYSAHCHQHDNRRVHRNGCHVGNSQKERPGIRKGGPFVTGLKLAAALVCVLTGMGVYPQKAAPLFKLLLRHGQLSAGNPVHGRLCIGLWP